MINTIAIVLNISAALVQALQGRTAMVILHGIVIYMLLSLNKGDKDEV